MSAYGKLEERFRRVATLEEVGAVLHWDLAVMMPPGGAAARAEQLAAIDLTCHELLGGTEVAEWLDAAEESHEVLDDWQRANLREMRRVWRHTTALDARLVDALTRAAKRCEMQWRQARPASDFASVRPALAELLSLTREAAAAKADALGCSAYDALLDRFEPGLGSADIDALFAPLASFLPSFLPAVLEKQRREPQPISPPGPFTVADQERLARRLMARLGFDFAAGRLDVSLHPFCGGVPDDLRVTTRFDQDDFTGAVMAVLHETGHALYEKGLPKRWRLQPVGRARGMAVHESQSLLVEMQACRSFAFARFLAPLAAEAFGGAGPAWTPENFHRLATRVEAGFIRVDADEVTYPAHVILRYRLERAMIAGDLVVDDLPTAWNELSLELLGTSPPEDRLGCLQDIHWYDGAFGYFPTYTLGAMMAAQLFDAACRAHPEIPEEIAVGDFSSLMDWLGREVHARASLLPTDELIRAVTGASLDPDIFKAHLRKRYLETSLPL